MKWGCGNCIKYISFKNSTSQMRIGVLHINSMHNIAAKYKYITNAHINDIVLYEGETESLKEIIIAVKKDGANTFIAAEQGSRKLANAIMVLFK